MMVKFTMRKSARGYNRRGPLFAARTVGKRTYRVDVPWHSLSFTPDSKGKPFWSLRGIVENNRAPRTQVLHVTHAVKD